MKPSDKNTLLPQSSALILFTFFNDIKTILQNVVYTLKLDNTNILFEETAYALFFSLL